MTDTYKDNLSELKVAELKKIAEDNAIEVKGLRKAEIVDVLYKYFDALADNSEESEINDIPESEPVEVEVPAANDDIVEDSEAEIVEPEDDFTDSLQTLELKKSVGLYSNLKFNKLLRLVSGQVTILEEFDSGYKIKYLNHILGYIKK